MPVIQRILTPGRAHKSLTLEMLGGLRAEDRGGASLRNNLVAFWPGDEASGNLIDAHSNGLDLTDVNTVTSNPGHVYDTARQYSTGPKSHHTRDSHTLLQGGDADFTFALWGYLDSKTASQGLLSKYGAGSSNTEYWLTYNQGADRFEIAIRLGDADAVVVLADTFGSPPVSTWFFLVWQYDSVNDQLHIQVNNGGVDSVGHAGGMNASASPFYIGSLQATVLSFNGRIGPTMMWKSAPGQGGVLSAVMRETVYNYGAGLQYLDLAEALTPPPDWWFFYNRDAEAAYQPLGADDYEDSLLDLTANDNDIAPLDWWTVAGKTCVVAHQPVGAADYAASKLDLTGNGNHATDGPIPPTWASGTGWTFVGASPYTLVTPYVPTNGNGTMLVRFSDAPQAAAACIAGLYNTATTTFLYEPNYSAGPSARFGNGARATLGTGQAAGTGGFAGNTAYEDGLPLAGTIGAWDGTNALPVRIGIRTRVGTDDLPFTGKVQAFVIYSDTLSDAEVATVSAAMEALHPYPTWATLTGWTFDGVDEYLDTGVVPVNDQSWSMFMKYSDFARPGATRIACGAVFTWNIRRFVLGHEASRIYASGGHSGLIVGVASNPSTGVQGLAGTKAYWDGVQQAGDIPASAGGTPVSIFLGGENREGALIEAGALKAQATAIYPNTLPPEMAAELADRMAVVGVAYKLETYWTGNGIIGDRIDLVGGQVLTASGSPTAAEGNIYDRARLYERIDLDYHSAPDSAALSMAGTDFTILAWVYLFDYDDDAYIVYKGGTNPTDREYDLGFVKATSLLKFSVKGPIGVAKSVSATSFGAVPLNTWTRVVAWYDNTAQTVNIQVNNGIVDSISHTKGVRENMGSFYMGVNAALNAYWDGMIGPVAMLKSLLTDHERDALWNAGAGRRIRG